MKLVLFVIALFLSAACSNKEIFQPRPVVVIPKPMVDTVKFDTIKTPKIAPKSYLALGDSYTIGQSVSPTESYPFQLVQDLKKHKLTFGEPTIIARTGWTTGELKSAISEAMLNKKFDFVTLLIGVNNQYRGLSKAEYRKEFIELLNTSLQFADGKKEHFFVISIPDWGVTSYGRESNKDMHISMEIDDFNTINKEESMKMNIAYINITSESRSALNDPSLIAADGLHPSGRMYADWVSLLSPEIQKVFK